MKSIKCDRCGNYIPYKLPYMNCAANGVITPKLTMTVWESVSQITREVDLCDDCQKAVYDYIFDYGNGVGS